MIPLDERAYTKGAIVGIAELVDIVHQSTDPWFIGPYGFVLANARRWSRSLIEGKSSCFLFRFLFFTRNSQRLARLREKHKADV